MAVLLDGSTQYATAPTAAINRDEGTFVAWINKDSSTPYMFLTDSDGTRHAFFWNASNTSVGFYIDGYETDWTITSVAGAWHHIACVYKKTGNVQKLYIDGSDQGAGSASGSWGSTGLGTNFYVGQRFDGQATIPSRFKGDMAEVAAYNIALTAADVAALALGYSPRLVRPDALVSYWPTVTPNGVPSFGGNALSWAGSPAASAHPRIFMPTTAQTRLLTTSVAPSSGTITSMLSLMGVG